jgi:hypothetical protein
VRVRSWFSIWRLISRPVSPASASSNGPGCEFSASALLRLAPDAHLARHAYAYRQKNLLRDRIIQRENTHIYSLFRGLSAIEASLLFTFPSAPIPSIA